MSKNILILIGAGIILIIIFAWLMLYVNFVLPINQTNQVYLPLEKQAQNEAQQLQQRANNINQELNSQNNP